ncbi:hypothetical protein DFH06DRAFT_1309714 [Mycena polygramma]|nr:hypothetical protein DFH06DRAFT_1309714 [Mycena polygramma]
MSHSLIEALSHLKSPKPALALLPFELWDSILDSLTDNNLLLTACVCRTFNEVSLTLYLLRHKVTATSTSLDVPSYFLKALHLLCATPKIDALRCKFTAFDVLPHMRCLQEVVAKCVQLTDVSLHFKSNILISDKRIGYYLTPEDVIPTLRDILRTITDRTPGPVIMVASGTICRVAPHDMASWVLRLPKVTKVPKRRWGGLLRRTDSVLQRGPTRPVFVLFHGHDAEELHVDSIYAVEVRSIRGGPGPLDRFTLITVQTAATDWGQRPFLSIQPTQSLPLGDLSTIISHIALPYLEHLDLKTPAIDPATLAAFLGQHPSITTLSFTQTSDVVSFPANTLTILCGTPIVLPKLIHLRANDGFALTSLLHSFDSLDVRVIDLYAPRSTPHHIAGWKSALRELSFRTQRTRLDLVPSLMVSSGGRLTVDDEERRLVRQLNCVECVCLTDTEIGSAYKVLEWVVLLPALHDFVLCLRRSVPVSNKTVTRFLDCARSLLPGVNVRDIPSW